MQNQTEKDISKCLRSDKFWGYTRGGFISAWSI